MSSSGNWRVFDNTGAEKVPVGSIGLPQSTSQVTGSDFTVSVATLTNVTGLTFAAAANKLYEVDVVLMGNSSGGGMNVGINYGAGDATGGFVTIGQNLRNTFANQASEIGTATVTFWTSSGVDGVVYLKGTIKTTATAANITVVVGRVSSGTVTIYKGSRMIVTTLL